MSAIVETVRHRVLGRMVRLRLVPGPELLLTPVEALTLSNGLSAVAAGNSAEKEIFLSPIASDAEFSGRVTAAGMVIGEHPVLAWPEVQTLSRELADAGR